MNFESHNVAKILTDICFVCFVIFLLSVNFILPHSSPSLSSPFYSNSHIVTFPVIFNSFTSYSFPFSITYHLGEKSVKWLFCLFVWLLAARKGQQFGWIPCLLAFVHSACFCIISFPFEAAAVKIFSAFKYCLFR